MTTTIVTDQEVMKGKSTLVRRVSDLFKADGNKSGPPSLFRNGSMQALRHCCQNLNLFPYLLYSFGRNSKDDRMMPAKMNVGFALLMTRITERIFRVYASIRISIICGLGIDSMSPSTNSVATSVIDKFTKAWINVEFFGQHHQQLLHRKQRTKQTIVAPVAGKFEKFEIQKPAENSVLLKFAVYLAPIVLAFQIIGIISLIALGKYTPGFVFLVSALFFLGYISMKVLLQDNYTSVHTLKREKRKIE